MVEIEDLLCFYEDGNVFYMIILVVGGIIEYWLSIEEVIFVFSEKWLIIVCYVDLCLFCEFENCCICQFDVNCSSIQLFVLMMDSLVDCIVDVLEVVQG